MEKEKILLIGAGFIGTNFYKMFHEGYDITIYDSFDYACTLANGLWDMDSPVVYKGDILDLEELRRIVDEVSPRYIINFAAKTHVDNSIHGDESFIPTNVIGVENILKAIVGKNIRFVQMSTDEVYGDTDVNSLEEFKETDKFNTSSPYSASKAAADMIVQAYVRTYGVDAVIARPTNNYGPYQFPEKFIPFTIKRLAEGKTIPIYGNGDNIREWIYVEDTCEAIELIMLNGEKGEAYNIGSGHDNRNTNVFIAGQIEGTNTRFEFISDRPGHDRRYAVDASKLKALGWEHTVETKAGLALTKEWYAKRIEQIKKMSSNKHLQ